jgi:hypothetical protein
MAAREKKLYSALKHAAYSSTTILPGEEEGAFEKLRQELMDEFSPTGGLEFDIVWELAHLVWRKQNLRTFRVANGIRAHLGALRPNEFSRLPGLRTIFEPDPAEEAAAEEEAKKKEVAYEAAKEQAKRELGETYQLVELYEATTVDGLMKELDVLERLNAMIEKCVKRLLLVRGAKSIADASYGAPAGRLAGSRRAA